MSIEITMPRLSDTMERGTIIKWHVAEGDAVSAGDVLADVETDKATMEMQAFDDGVVTGIMVQEGQPVDVGTICAVLAEEDDGIESATPDEDDELEFAQPDTNQPDAARFEPSSADVLDATPDSRTMHGARPEPSPRHAALRVTPVARRLAETNGVDLSALSGSGPSGRITKKDVLAAVAMQQEMQSAVPPSASPHVLEAAPTLVVETQPALVPARTPPTRDGVPSTPVSSGQLAVQQDDRREPVSGMRQTIARRLVQSKQEIPHYQVSMSFDMDPMVEFRTRINSELAAYEVKLSVNDLIVRACALAMADNPLMNASWDGDAILYHNRVHVGVAVALSAERGGGLVVPVIHDADRKSLRSISAETRALAAKARDRGLSPEDMDGATFTVSNLGMFGVDDFTAIINPPNSAILAVGGTLQRPVVRDNAVVVGWVMKVTLSNDHRVVDGATAAAYLQTLKSLIEHPSMILV